MKSNLYTKDLIYDMSISYNLSIQDSRKAIQFVFAFMFMKLLQKWCVSIGQFANFFIQFRKEKKTTFFDKKSVLTIPKRKVLLCKFRKKLHNKTKKTI